VVENTISASLILVEKFVPMRIQWSNPCGQKDSVLTVRWYDGVTRYKRPFVVYESCPHENGEWRVIRANLPSLVKHKQSPCWRCRKRL